MQITTTYRSGPARLTVAAIMPLYNKRNTVIEAIDSVSCHNLGFPTRSSLSTTVRRMAQAEVVLQRYGQHRLIRLVRQENRGVALTERRHSRGAIVAAGISRC